MLKQIQFTTIFVRYYLENKANFLSFLYLDAKDETGQRLKVASCVE